MICRKCGSDTSWYGGALTNHDGTAHWDVCKQRQIYRVRAFGSPYIEQNEYGYVFAGERWAMWKRGPKIAGDKYQPSNCDCGVPPWEGCKHTLAA